MDQHQTQNFLVQLSEQFAHSKNWKRRQTYALLCDDLLAFDALSTELFNNEIMPHLIDLSWDPVANVRLVAARIICKQIVTNGEMRKGVTYKGNNLNFVVHLMDPSNQHYDSLQTVIRRLQTDKDPDVRHSAQLQNSNTNVL